MHILYATTLLPNTPKLKIFIVSMNEGKGFEKLPYCSAAPPSSGGESGGRYGTAVPNFGHSSMVPCCANASANNLVNPVANVAKLSYIASTFRSNLQRCRSPVAAIA